MVRVSLLSIILLPAVASAYELKRDSTGEIIRWGKQVEFVIEANAGAALNEPKAFDAVQSAVETFNQTTHGLTVSVREGQTGGVGYDTSSGAKNQNDIVVLNDWTFDANAIAVTVVTVDTRSHRILDADIAFNAKSRKFKVLDREMNQSEHDDIQNTFTHELGHAVGLAHNSSDAGVVMYPGARRGELKKRTLSDDDRAGLLDLYPGAITQTAQQAADGEGQVVGCSAGAGTTSGWLFLALLPLVFLKRSRKAAAVIAVALPAVALASEPVRPVADARNAAVVATAEVISTRLIAPAPKQRLLFTEVELEVRSCLKGQCAQRMKLIVPGGKQGHIEQMVEGNPAPTQGEVLGLTLQPGASERAPQPKQVALYQLGQMKDFAAFAAGLSRAGLNTSLPFPQVPAALRVTNDPGATESTSRIQGQRTWPAP